MPTAIFVPRNSIVTVNGVDLSDQVQSATMRYEYDALVTDTIASSAHTFADGLQNNSCSITFMMSYAATEPYATLKALVGNTTTITIKPSTGTTSATNPVQTLTATFLPGIDVYNASAGEISTITAEWVGGTYTEVIS